MPSLLRSTAVVSLLAAACGGTGSDAAVDPTVRDEVSSVTTIAYGDVAPDQVADLSLPDGDGPFPVVVMIHGGFWRTGFDNSLGAPLCADVVERRLAACWNIEYRRVGSGGGWPTTFDDVAAALDHLAVLDDARLDLQRVVTIGHSAGGHLAVWAASRQNLLAGEPGADPAVVPIAAISQAGVLDLVKCADERVGQTACPDLMDGTPAGVPDRYAAASPVALVPISASVTAVHGSADRIVPPSQSEAYAEAARLAGQDVEVVIIDGVDHFAHLDVAGDAWSTVIAALEASVG